MSHTKVTLVSVSEPKLSDTGIPYFIAAFKAGVIGKLVRRTMYGKTTGDGTTEWERASPEELSALKGHDLSGEVSIEAVEVEPQEFVVPMTGEVKIITSRSIVRFADETTEVAVRRSGSVLRQSATLPVSAPLVGAFPGLPAGMRIVSTNGHGA